MKQCSHRKIPNQLWLFIDLKVGCCGAIGSEDYAFAHKPVPPGMISTWKSFPKKSKVKSIKFYFRVSRYDHGIRIQIWMPTAVCLVAWTMVKNRNFCISFGWDILFEPESYLLLIWPIISMPFDFHLIFIFLLSEYLLPPPATGAMPYRVILLDTHMTLL